LLTGFLGSGKTTLLNAILSTKTGPKIVVIVNEFGEAGLDRGLIARQEAGRISFERVVIETTGLADPAPIYRHSPHTLFARPWSSGRTLHTQVTTYRALNCSKAKKTRTKRGRKRKNFRRFRFRHVNY
jgi:G3E family GTPase